ncbi:MAG TPA: protein kinase [Pyrinomonadaceae bacterium]|nr:protein kinase [Pyrinomonadaceae bacterium]
MSLSPATSLGHYKIHSQLGAGGMGEVYLAYDVRLNRQVALKVLPANLVNNRTRLYRFEQEARATSALNHPNIITIHEIGSCVDTVFIAMEFIEGETLRNKLKTTRVEIEEALDIAIQIAAALDVAHRSGIVHRDIKPENIMVREDGLVKVLDFGLAKLTEKKSEDVDSEAATRPEIRTEAKMILGTVAYMSPEQARGLPIDARTDIFSLGVVIYEKLSGRLPFPGETTNDMIAAILKSEPAPLDEITPPELQRIVRKSLQKKADERYQTVKDLLIDLKNLKHDLDFTAKLERSGKQTKAEPSKPAQDQSIHTTSSAEYIASGIRQYMGVFTAALAVLLLGALGFGYWFYKHRSSTASQIESIAVLPFQNSSGNPDVEYLSDGMAESLINSLSRLPKLNVKGRSSVFRYKGKEVEAQTIGADLNVQAVLMGRITLRGDDLILNLSLEDARTGNRIWGEQYNRKLMDLLLLQGEIAHDVSEKLRLRLTGTEQQRLTKQGTQNSEAYQAYLMGRFYWNKGLAPGFEKSREYFQQAIDLDPTYALAYSGLADYYGFASALGLLPPNENWPKAEAAANKALALDNTLAETYNPLAAVKLYYYRDWPAAERYFRRGIELNPNYAEIHAHYASSLRSFGRNEDALVEIQRSVELDPLSPRFNSSWGKILFSIRQYDRAIDQFRKTLELDPNEVMAHEFLGYAYEQKGMQREAIAEWSKALTLRGASEQASTLERAYAASGFEHAIGALAQEQLAQLNERMKHGKYVPASDYVTAYTRLGDKEQAFAWLNRAVDERTGFVFEIKISPVYDRLRDDSRFQDLLQHNGLMP